MKSIEILNQNGFDIEVEFTHDDDTVESKTISIRPYYTDVESLVPDTDAAGNEIVDADGNVLMKRVLTKVWHDPVQNIEDFLRNWALAYEAGIVQETATEIDGSIINRKIRV